MGRGLGRVNNCTLLNAVLQSLEHFLFVCLFGTFIIYHGGGGVGAFCLRQNEFYLTPLPLLSDPPYSVSDNLSNLPSTRKPKNSPPQKNPLLHGRHRTSVPSTFPFSRYFIQIGIVYYYFPRR